MRHIEETGRNTLKHIDRQEETGRDRLRHGETLSDTYRDWNR